MIHVLLATFRPEPEMFSTQVDSIRRQRGVEVNLVFREDAGSEGACANFAALLEAASAEISDSDYIAFSDQDDVWLPDKLKVMEDYFLSHPEVGVAYCRRSLIDQNGNPISERLTELFSNYHPLDSSYFYAEFCKDFPDCAGCMSAIRKSLIDKLFPFPDLWAHDTWIFTMAPMYTQMKTLPDVLMLFRRHGNNASALGKETDWANGRDVYYLTSVGQYRAHTP